LPSHWILHVQAGGVLAHLVVSGRLAESTAQSAAVGDHRKLEVTALGLPQRDDASRICSLGNAAQSGPCRSTWKLSDSLIHLFLHSSLHPFHHSFVSFLETVIHHAFISFTHSFICSLGNSFISFPHSFMYFVHSHFAVGLQSLLMYIHRCTLSCCQTFTLVVV